MPATTIVQLPKADATGFDPSAFEKLKSGSSSLPTAAPTPTPTPTPQPTQDDLAREEAKGKALLEKDASSEASQETVKHAKTGEESATEGDDSKSSAQADESAGEQALPSLELKKKVLQEPKVEVKPDDKAKPGRPLEVTIPEGVDPRIKSFLKDMSKPAREFVLARLGESAKQINQLKAQQGGELPPAYFEHPDAWTLHPEVKVADEAIQRESWAKSHWEKQFEAVRLGEKWQDLTVGADGKIVAVEKTPSAQAEAYLLGKVQHATQVINGYTQRVGHIQNNFKGIVNNAMTALHTLENQLFPQFAEPDAVKDNPHIAVMSQTLAARHLDKTPLSSMFTKLYAHSREQQAYIEELEAKVGGKPVFTKADVGLNSADFNEGGGKSLSQDPDERPFDPKAFENLKR